MSGWPARYCDSVSIDQLDGANLCADYRTGL